MLDPRACTVCMYQYVSTDGVPVAAAIPVYSVKGTLPNRNARVEQ